MTRHRNPTAWAETIAARQVTTADHADASLIKLHDAFDQLKAGTKDSDFFDRLGVAFNCGLIRAEQISELCVAPILAAHEAMHRCADICQRHGHYGFDGPGLQAVKTGLEVYEQILRNSSPAQMRDALVESTRRMAQQLAEAQP